MTDKKYLLQYVRHYLTVSLLLIVSMLAQASASDQRGNTIKNSRKQEAPLIIIGASYAKDWNILLSGHYRIVNQGIGGEETYQMRARFDNDVLKHRPSAVLIWGFINDIFRSPREGISDKMTRTRENLLTMITQAERAGIRPILATEVLMATPDHISEKFLAWVGKMRGKQSYQDYVNAHVRDMNSWLRKIAKEKRITVLDFERLLADDSGGRQSRYASEDGSHLSVEAYTALTEYVNRELSQK